ncbi:uncharacterized protein LOC106457049 isoform X2 [Limulus polyphemus]|uniref:Uncharacterized protein LOC106457049 isoform X2 n=1 Tax=Limulus polyphemus TaxID=6850 RepID=A0ABM1S4L3_LIMPO|nr:uncharacterized protein LOC106457049 isoform X2 [Limulus polyphemus]
MDSKKFEEGLKHEVQRLKQQNEKLMELLTKCKVVLQLMKSRTHALVKENKSLLKLVELKTKELKDFQSACLEESTKYQNVRYLGLENSDSSNGKTNTNFPYQFDEGTCCQVCKNPLGIPGKCTIVSS